MDILLTHAYYLYEDPAERKVMKPYPPLGLLYLTSHLRSLDFDVCLIDSTFMKRDEHLGVICSSAAPIIGLYVNLMTRGNAVAVMREAKAAGAKVILGGPEPVNYPDEYFDRGCDVIVSGEGELTLAELLACFKSGGGLELSNVPGIIYRNADGQTITTRPREQLASLDGRPYPARDAIDMQRYLDTWRGSHGASSVSLITARGCPYTCRWCSHSVYGFTYRHRSPADVADELVHIDANYAPDQVWYADDVFTMSRHWLRAYAEELERRGLHKPFETISREDRLDEEMVDLLVRLGCYRLWVGAESGSQRVLDSMDRRTDAVRMREMIGLLKQKGIRTGTFIMLGYEGETWGDIDRTADHLREALPDDVLTTLAYPIKGTPYYDDVAGRITNVHDWESSSDREYSVAGRFSRRFYAHAQKWLGAEVRLAREHSRPRRSLMRLSKSFLHAKRHRAAMYLLRHEVEQS